MISLRIVYLGVNSNGKHLAPGKSCMLVMHGNRLFQATNLAPITSLHQERFGGKMPSTLPIVTYLGLAIL